MSKTYAVRKAIQTAIEKEKRLVSKAVERTCSGMVRAFSNLNPVYETLIYSRLKGNSLRTTGGVMGFSHPRARQCELRAFMKWRALCQREMTSHDFDLVFQSGTGFHGTFGDMLKRPEFNYFAGCIAQTGADSDPGSLAERQYFWLQVNEPHNTTKVIEWKKKTGRPHVRQ